MAKHIGSWVRTLGAVAPGLLGLGLAAAHDEGGPGGSEPVQLKPLRPLPKDGPSPAVPGGRNGRHEWVDWRGQRIPLAEPVQDCTFGQSADGKMLAILAGGLRESLDLYLVDSSGGLLMRLPTYGGHCLPLAFNDGSGSLPALDGHDLVLFAFEREGRVHFRAIDPAGGVHASRELPLKVTGFRAVSDLRTSKVEVRFENSDLAARFDHPSAPVLELEPWVLTFPATPVGEKVFATARILNKGRRSVEIPLEPKDGEFTIATSGAVTIGPGQQGALTFAFRPSAAGARTGQLVLHGPRDLVVKLRGRGQAATDIAAQAKKLEPPPVARVAWTPPPPAPEPVKVAAPAPELAKPATPKPEVARLSEVDGVLIVCGAPFQTFVLTALEAGRGEADARPLLGGLRGQLDAEGFCRLPLSVLGAISERFAVVAIVTTPSGRRVRTECVEIGPEPR